MMSYIDRWSRRTCLLLLQRHATSLSKLLVNLAHNLPRKAIILLLLLLLLAQWR